MSDRKERGEGGCESLGEQPPVSAASTLRAESDGELCVAMQIHCPVCLAAPAPEDGNTRLWSEEEKKKRKNTDRKRERERRSRMEMRCKMKKKKVKMGEHKRMDWKKNNEGKNKQK